MESNEEDLDLLMRRTSDVQSTLKSVTAMAQKMMVDARRDKEKRSSSELQEDPKKLPPLDLSSVDHTPPPIVDRTPLSMVDHLMMERDDLKKDFEKANDKMTGYQEEIEQLKRELESRAREVDSLRDVMQNGSGTVATPPTLQISPKGTPKTHSTPKGSSYTKACPMDTPPVLDTPLGTTTQPDSSYVSTFFAGSDQPVTDGNTPPTDAIWADNEEFTLLLVFRYLSIPELFRVGGVCKKWREVSRHPSLWKEVQFHDLMLTPEMLRYMAGWCTQTELLKLHGLIPVPAAADEGLDTYVQQQRGSMESSLAVFFQSSGHCLRKVYITECHVMVTERVLWLLGIYCPNLQEVAYSSFEFPACAEAIWSLSCGSPDIRAIYFPPVTESEMMAHFNDHCLFRIATGFPRLRCAAVGGPSITPRGVAQFILDCPNLKDLRLVECFEINQSTIKKLLSIGSTKLMAISFINTQVTPRAISILADSWQQLRKIHVYLSFFSYFDDVNDQKSRTEYRKILSRLKELRRYQCLQGKLQVFSEHN